MEPRHLPQRTEGSGKEPEKSPLNLSAELLTHFNLSDISDDDLPVPKMARKKKILLVNNRSTDIEELEAELARREEGESVVESTSDLEEALELLSAEEIDLIALMLDPDLSETDNFASVERLHNHNPEVPIVVLVDNDDRSLAIESLRHGAQDYLAFDGLPFDELIERVLQYSLERKRADQVNHLALKLEKATIRSILEHSPMVMIRLDNRCRILDCNQSFEKALGLPKEEI
ncbi:MAG: response regulator [Cyanobacteriota/Melainabacteria group bacterium]